MAAEEGEESRCLGGGTRGAGAARRPKRGREKGGEAEGAASPTALAPVSRRRRLSLSLGGGRRAGAGKEAETGPEEPGAESRGWGPCGGSTADAVAGRAAEGGDDVEAGVGVAGAGASVVSTAEVCPPSPCEGRPAVPLAGAPAPAPSALASSALASSRLLVARHIQTRLVRPASREASALRPRPALEEVVAQLSFLLSSVAAGGAGASVLVAGGPGVGKTLAVETALRRTGFADADARTRGGAFGAGSGWWERGEGAMGGEMASSGGSHGKGERLRSDGLAMAGARELRGEAQEGAHGELEAAGPGSAHGELEAAGPGGGARRSASVAAGGASLPRPPPAASAVPRSLGVVRLRGCAHRDERSALRAAASSLCLAFGLSRASSRGGDDATFLRAALGALAASGRACAIVLEDLDAYALRSRQGLLYALLDAVQHAGVRAVVLGTTRRVDCVELLEKRVRSRFGHRTLWIDGPNDSGTQAFRGAAGTAGRGEAIERAGGGSEGRGGAIERAGGVSEGRGGAISSGPESADRGLADSRAAPCPEPSARRAASDSEASSRPAAAAPAYAAPDAPLPEPADSLADLLFRCLCPPAASAEETDGDGASGENAPAFASHPALARELASWRRAAAEALEAPAARALLERAAVWGAASPRALAAAAVRVAERVARRARDALAASAAREPEDGGPPPPPPLPALPFSAQDLVAALRAACLPPAASLEAAAAERLSVLDLVVLVAVAKAAEGRGGGAGGRAARAAQGPLGGGGDGAGIGDGVLDAPSDDEDGAARRGRGASSSSRARRGASGAAAPAGPAAPAPSAFDPLRCSASLRATLREVRRYASAGGHVDRYSEQAAARAFEGLVRAGFLRLERAGKAAGVAGVGAAGGRGGASAAGGGGGFAGAAAAGPGGAGAGAAPTASLQLCSGPIPPHARARLALARHELLEALRQAPQCPSLLREWAAAAGGPGGAVGVR